MFLHVAPTSGDLSGDRFENEIRRVDLAMGMRVRDADDLAFILKDQDMINFWPLAQLAVLLLPAGEQGENLVDVEFGERRVVERTVADDAGLSRGGTIEKQAAF